MPPWLRGTALGLTLLMTSVGGGPAEAQERVLVTVRQLFDQAHRLEVPAGTEVVWADPHFERVWFPTDAENPTVKRVAGGFRAIFAKPGTYRGAFTVVGGHQTNDFYNLIVVVKPRSQ
jgi:hypothetical protein